MLFPYKLVDVGIYIYIYYIYILYYIYIIYIIYILYILYIYIIPTTMLLQAPLLELQHK